MVVVNVMSSNRCNAYMSRLYIISYLIRPTFMKNGRPTQLWCFVSGLSPNSAKKANGIKLRVTKEKWHGTLAAAFSSGEEGFFLFHWQAWHVNCHWN